MLMMLGVANSPMKVNNIDTPNQWACQTMEEDSTAVETISIKDIWNRLPLMMKIAIVVGDLFILGFLIYYFTS